MKLTPEEFAKRVHNAAKVNYKRMQKVCGDGHTNANWPAFDSEVMIRTGAQGGWLDEAEAVLRAGFPEMCS